MSLSRLDAGAAGPEEGWPAVSRTSLYSYLVTRHTGRAVRLGIERRLAEYDRHVLTVLDFRHVPLIDFSCADEVVAKLVRRGLAETEPRRFFLFRGVCEHHLDPIQSALERQALAVAAESAVGEPLLLGSVDRQPARAWNAVWQLGLAATEGVAALLGSPPGAAGPLLEELEARRLVLRCGPTYVSFGRALQDATSELPADESG